MRRGLPILEHLPVWPADTGFAPSLVEGTQAGGLCTRLRGRKAQAILCYLALCAEPAVPRRRLVQLLWSGRGMEQGLASLRQSLLELRGALAAAPGLLVADRHTLSLDRQRLAILQFDGLAAARLLDTLWGLDPAFDRWIAQQRRAGLSPRVEEGAGPPGPPPRLRRPRRLRPERALPPGFAPLELSPLANATARLAEGLVRYRRDTSDTQIRDGLIQRFECTYDLAHAMLRRALEQAAANPGEIGRMGFAELLRSGVEQGWVPGSWPQWRAFREMRNIASQTHEEARALQVTAGIPAFLAEAQGLLARLAAGNGQSRGAEADGA